MNTVQPKPGEDKQGASEASRPPSAAMSRRWGSLLALLLIIGLISFFIFHSLKSRNTLPDGLIQANGRVEGDTISIACKYSGRIDKILVREGDQVTQGQVLAQLDDAQVNAKVSQTAALLSAAQFQLKASQNSLDTARKEVPLAIRTAQAGVEHAQAVLAKAEASEKQAGRDAERFTRLAEKGSIGKQRAEQAQLAWTSARSELEAARTGLRQATEQLNLAQLGWNRTHTLEGQVQALASQRDQARSGLADVQSVLADLTLRAPINGVITMKIRDVGEVVSAGSPVYELVDLDRLYLKVYVPENQIGKLHLGLPAQVYIDAYPDQAFSATVGYIADRAEFTPKEVQTPDERVKLVFAVKLYFSANPQHRLVPGIPADAVIRWKESAPWAKPVR